MKISRDGGMNVTQEWLLKMGFDRNGSVYQMRCGVFDTIRVDVTFAADGKPTLWVQDREIKVGGLIRSDIYRVVNALNLGREE